MKLIHLLSAVTMSVALVLVASGLRPALAADVREFKASDQVLHMEPVSEMCLLEREKRAHRQAWQYAEEQVGDSTILALLSLCSGADRGEFFGLVAVFVVNSQIGLRRTEISRAAESWVAKTEIVLTEPDRFPFDAFRLYRLRTPRTDTVTGLYVDNIFIEVGEVANASGRTMVVAGITPTFGILVRTLSLDLIEDEEQLAAHVSLHTEILQSIRRNNRPLTLRRKK